MADDIEFIDNTIEVKRAISDAAIAFLYAAVAELQGQAIRNTVRKTGQTKDSWETAVDEKELVGYVGGSYFNLILEEFGTGEFALNGDGRKTPWKYQDEKGEWHTTTGKKPRRMLYKAFEEKKDFIQTTLADHYFKEL